LALVTGASRGIGAAIANALAPTCDLLLTARTAEALAPVAASARALGAEVRGTFGVALDDADETARLCETIAALGVDVLVCNAGVAPSAPLSRTDDQMWRSVMAVNLDAPFRLMRALVPAMSKRGWGRVVHVASTAALKGYRYTSAYSASKGGLVALVRAVAAEVATSGVTVNAICPGFVDTDIVANAAANIATRTGRDAAAAKAELAAFSPQRRLVHPDEVAAMVAYLVSDAAAAIHGQALALDGGETTL
jgi:NAD(P)-dependent dehydrogenase (short-subunit alcohol dehydrogenase family)